MPAVLSKSNFNSGATLRILLPYLGGLQCLAEAILFWVVRSNKDAIGYALSDPYHVILHQKVDRTSNWFAIHVVLKDPVVLHLYHQMNVVFPNVVRQVNGPHSGGNTLIHIPAYWTVSFNVLIQMVRCARVVFYEQEPEGEWKITTHSTGNEIFKLSIPHWFDLFHVNRTHFFPSKLHLKHLNKPGKMRFSQIDEDIWMSDAF